VLSTPVNVVATGNVGNITITWDAVPGATGYDVFWSATPGVTSSSAMIGTSATSSFVDTEASGGGTTDYYKVSATDAMGSSPLSAEVSAIMP